MTAAEAVAMFEANPELVESRAREKAARLVRARADNEAAREVYEDLAAVGGGEVSSLYDLHRTPGYSALASPVLMKHLERGGYPLMIMEGLMSRLDLDWIRKNWDRVVAVYRTGVDRDAFGALAGVMSQAARKSQLPDLMEMVQDSSLPPTRGMFVGKVLRLGGEEGLALIESLKDDPDVGLEATARLKMRQRRRQAGMKRPPETSSN